MAVIFMVYLSGLSFMPCIVDSFHTEVQVECADTDHDNEPQHQHTDSNSHCMCHCHHINAYSEISTFEVETLIEPAAHISFYQNQSSSSHLQGLFKPPRA
ncbi:hypothetical protein G3O08_03745 [Cryomorpha ignava]|uniref:DUF2946 domain-containing protein n=1 Tax=Cryomorpha ignava TaxID=101383 RepID=A0A7K3WLU4_9FLAO|nr:hypothetical protein [Cryomorpha ignava]NEN22617.1 hypothetical protein [Cryomorpha ignava]